MARQDKLNRGSCEDTISDQDTYDTVIDRLKVIEAKIKTDNELKRQQAREAADHLKMMLESDRIEEQWRDYYDYMEELKQTRKGED